MKQYTLYNARTGNEVITVMLTERQRLDYNKHYLIGMGYRLCPSN